MPLIMMLLELGMTIPPDEESEMKLSGQKAAILVEQDFQDEEAMEPARYLEEKGLRVTFVAPKRGTYRGKHGRETVEKSEAVSEVEASDFDCIVIPGGAAPEKLRVNDDILVLVRAAFDLDMPVAAICHGPQVLISADVLNGRTITCYAGIRDDVQLAGARYVDEPVVVDGNLVTSRKPDDLPDFLKALASLLSGTEDEAGEEYSPKEALETAIDKEVEAYQFYCTVAEQYSGAAQTKFLYLCETEKGHRRALEKMYETLGHGQYEPHPDPGGRMDRLKDAHTPSDILELAMEAEIRAYRRYRSLAHRAKNPDGKAVFERLAQDELEHYRLLDVELKVISGTLVPATDEAIPPGFEELW
jgi:protease I